MTIQITSLLIGCLIPLLWSGAVLPYRQRQLGIIVPVFIGFKFDLVEDEL